MINTADSPLKYSDFVRIRGIGLRLRGTHGSQRFLVFRMARVTQNAIFLELRSTFLNSPETDSWVEELSSP